MATHTSMTHVFSVADLTVTFDGLILGNAPNESDYLDLAGLTVPPITDKDGNEMYGVDSEFGFYVTDFRDAEQKEIDGDYAEGHAGNILNESDPSIIEGISIKNAVTDVFRSGAPFGTWSLGLGGALVKASTEHYVTMSDILSDQAFPGDPDAEWALDNDLKLRDQYATGVDGALEAGPKHNFYVEELTGALQRAIDNVGGSDQEYSDIDFDRDGTTDPFTTRSVIINYDADGDGVAEAREVGGIDLGSDGTVDVVDSPLNGLGVADIVDLIEPNESTVLHDIAYGRDYSVTVKDDGKLLYRFGEAVKRPNDIRMEVKLDLPTEWTEDLDSNGIADSLENGVGFVVTKAELVINHDITNNPNDQVRPEDYENEAAIGRLPSHYVIRDPDDPSNTLWVSPVDSYDGSGEFLPSYFLLTDAGEVDLDPAVKDNPLYNPNGELVGYRNTDEFGDPIGTVLRDYSLIAKNSAAGLSFVSSDLAGGFTVNWYTTVDREPFEWSFDKFSSDPFKNVFESFRSFEEGEAAGYSDEDLWSGPRWRLTPNKFGQDLPGIEIPLEPNTPPPYQRDNIKYETGTQTTTKLNLLDWDGPSPLSHSSGWMTVDRERLDENRDGVIDDGWADVTTIDDVLQAGDAVPTDLILSAVTPNGMNLTQDFLDTAVYVKGDRQDSAQIQDMYLDIEYIDNVIGAVQTVSDLTEVEQTIGYEMGAVFSNPVVFASPLSYDGPEAASVAFSSITSHGVTLYVDEADYHDGIHRWPDDVSLLTLQEGSWQLEDGTRLEVGTEIFSAGPTNTFHSVVFDWAFEDVPTVLVQLQTQNDPTWAVLRTDNISTSGFDFLLQHEEANSGLEHGEEIVGWMAIDTASPSGLVDWGTVLGQDFSLPTVVDHTGFEFTFDSALGSDPIIAAHISSFYGPNTANLRLVDVTADSFAATAEFLVKEESSLDAEQWHVLEDLNGLAFSGAGILQGEAIVDDFLIA